MKKILTFLSIVAVLQAGAQGYQKMIADSITKFNVVPLYIPVMAKNTGNQQNQTSNCVNANPGYWEARTDSVYKGNTYKRFYMSGSPALYGLMREDTIAEKVYFIQYCDTVEALLYDFSLTQGSTLVYNFSNAWGVTSGTFTVDSIRLRHDYHTYRRHFYLRNHSANNAILEMVEGVGNVNHPLFLYYGFNMGILSWGPGSQNCPGTQFDEILSCKWDDGVKIYYDSCTYTAALSNNCVGVSDTCQYQTVCSGIEEFTGVKSVLVYPNPASETIHIAVESEKQIDLSFSMVNVFGTEVKKDIAYQLIKGKNRLHIDVKDLPVGIYLLRITDGEKTAGKTVLIDR